MSGLFTRQPDASLVERLCPYTLDDVIGQQHLIGEGKPLHAVVKGGKLYSMLLWGPPDVGKTTLTRILAQGFSTQFPPVPAVFSGVKDIREAVDEAEIVLQQGRTTILFVDEVHRFSKAQQDTFLSYVENGLLTFIGVTTENLSFEVNPALLSRTQVYVLQFLSSDGLKKLTAKVLALPEYRNFTIEADAQELLVNIADGDARRLLNLLEQLLRVAGTRRLKTLTAEFLVDSSGAQIRRSNKGGESFYNQISVLHKSARGSCSDTALYWFCRMLDGGIDPRYLACHIVRMAQEDTGLADPHVFQIANDAAATFERLSSPEGELVLVQAVLYPVAAAKSNADYRAYNQMRRFAKENINDEMLAHLCNTPTKLMRELGYGREYRYAHDEPNAYVTGESYIPDGLDKPDFYQPVPCGLETKTGEEPAWLKSLDEEAFER